MEQLELVTGGTTINHIEKITTSAEDVIIEILKSKINKMKNKIYWLYAIIGAEAIYIILSNFLR